MSWDSLPVEIQTHILDDLLLHEESARYASVCRVWQTIMEPRTFARLKVTQWRLADFGDIGYRHRHLVKDIWLSIEPLECPDCGGEGIFKWRQVSASTMVKAIEDLVILLSTWEPSGSLSLDISVKAPSAAKHSSRTSQYGPGVISEPKKAKRIQCSPWSHDASVQGPAMFLFDTRADFSKPEPRLRKKMPKARAVTSLLLRRQTRRFWTSKVLEDLLDLLPEVHEFHYEPWRDWRRMQARPTNTSKARDTSL